jgi:tetratricopeptide (TPR) repeat protein
VHFTRALALLDRLPSSEQMLVRAEIAGWRGDRGTAIEILRGYLREHPNDPSAMFSLAYHYMRSHRYAESRDEFLRLTAIDSLNYAVWINLAVVDRAQGDLRGALAASARSFALDSSAMTRGNLNNEYGGTYVSLGLPDSAEWVFRRMLTGSPGQRTSGYQSLAFLDVWSGHYARAVSHLDSAIVIDRAENDSAGEARRQLYKAELETSVGNAAAARADMSQFMALFHGTYLEPTLLLWAGRIAARRGDHRELTEILDSLTHRARRESTTDQAALADVQGELALLDGHLGSARASFALGMTLEPDAFEREGAAHAAFVDHDWPVAERIYRTLGDSRGCCFEGDEMQLLAPYWLGRVAAGRGDSAAARTAYDRLITQWGAGDSGIVALRDARARRAALGP